MGDPEPSDVDALVVLSPPHPVVRVYKRRWYLLIVYCLIGFWQADIWNLYGPLAESLKAAYPDHWADETTAMMGNWAVILYLPLFLPTVWAALRFGLRVSIGLALYSTAIACFIRIFSESPQAFVWTAHVGSLLNGCCGVIAVSLIPAFSATWFPPSQRTSATAILQTANQMGVAGSFFFSNLFVPDPAEVPSKQDEMLQRSDLNRYFCFNAIISLVLLVIFLTYFPSSPSLPPSHSSSAEVAEDRPTLRESCKTLLRSRPFWLLALSFSSAQGVLGVWMSVLDISVEPLKVDQHLSDWLGVCAVFGQVVVTNISSAVCDRFSGHLKQVALTLLCLSVGFYVWFSLLIVGVAPYSSGALFTSVVMGTSLTFAAYPLYLELAMESMFPIQEQLLGAVMNMLQNSLGAVFLSLCFIKGIGSTWMSFVQIGSVLVSIPLLYLAPVTYRRSAEDRPSVGS